MGEGAAQDVANLSELHPQDIRVQNLHFHGLVLPAPLLVRNTHWHVQRWSRTKFLKKSCTSRRKFCHCCTRSGGESESKAKHFCRFTAEFVCSNQPGVSGPPWTPPVWSRFVYFKSHRLLQLFETVLQCRFAVKLKCFMDEETLHKVFLWKSHPTLDHP